MGECNVFVCVVCILVNLLYEWIVTTATNTDGLKLCVFAI